MEAPRRDPEGVPEPEDIRASRALRPSFPPVVTSFVHAMEGLSYVYLTQRNMRIHVLAAALVGAACIFLGVGRVEVLMVLLASAGVLVAEVVNTLTESLVDLLEPRYHPAAKVVKDVAAAGVLIASVFAVFIGFVAFFPALMELPLRFKGLVEERLALFIAYICVAVVPSLVGLFFVEFRSPGKRPSSCPACGDKEGK